MKKTLFYPRLAVTNIKKNGKFYFPYILICITTIAMFYIISMLSFGKALDNMRGVDTLKLFMILGMIVIGLFSVIFLFYTNSFLMKRRKKEFGLFNILGMEKRHIARGLLYETIYIALITIILGIGCGILFSKLVIMLLGKFMNYQSAMVFDISGTAIGITVILFTAIFLLILLSNFIRISTTKPIELLKGSSSGEKEPRTKALLALIGVAALGGGYYLALITESPADAMVIFFFAVILVIIGTYCLFTAGSIVLLKIMRRNKKYYYQIKHFTSVSGMLYRMKQNAVGMGNICILSTMVLVMLSGTVALNVGFEDSINSSYPYDLSYEIIANNVVNESELIRQKDELEALVQEVLDGFDIGKKEVIVSGSFSVSAAQLSKGVFDGSRDFSISQGDIAVFNIFSESEYNALTGELCRLDGNEILLYVSDGESLDKFSLFGIDITVKSELDGFVIKPNKNIIYDQYFIVADDKLAQELFDIQRQVYEGAASPYNVSCGIDLECQDEEKMDVYNALKQEIRENKPEDYGMYSFSRLEVRESWFTMYGGFLFLGVFLGILFIMATMLIIYYKQISEGYDDKQRFEIMQKVGMSRDEVKASISSQVKKVFLIPLIMAVIHIAFAFKMITKLLAILGLHNITLFLICTVVTVIVFAIIYALMYAMTARTYYKIVS